MPASRDTSCPGGTYRPTLGTMRIAFLHYHLKPGGVTTVIRHQIAALDGAAETLVLTGEPCPPGFPAATAHLPGLAYDTVRDPAWTVEAVAAAVKTAIGGRWPGGCDVLHVHNPTLAKNGLLPAVLKRLQQAGTKLFLQVHDFAEDGRPGAYAPDPYPANCHYGVLNRRDLKILQTAGLCREGLHLLPNQVRPPAAADPPLPVADHVLYPVRAIRRKNIGEAVLFSCFLPAGGHLAVTLGPNSPADMGPYRCWKRFTTHHRLPVVWEAAARGDFSRLVQTARFLITTSVSEGFGFAFLEPWTAGKLLWGRRLPAVCDDFARNGIDLEHLYPSLPVPIAWLDRQRWRTRWLNAAVAARTAFGQPLNPETAEAAFERLAAADTIDFGLLDETLQAEILERCLQSDAGRGDLVALNPYLANSGKIPNPAALIRANAAAVSRHYSQAADRRRLLDAYAGVQQPVVHRIDKQRLLDAFFDLNRFSLLRWGSWTD